MKQLKFKIQNKEHFEHFEIDGEVYNLGSPQYEKNVEQKINYMLNNNKKNVQPNKEFEVFRGVKFYDVIENIHLRTIREMPGILHVDGININIASKNEIEKVLLRKTSKFYLIACYRLWQENAKQNIIYTDASEIFVVWCGWEYGKMCGLVNISVNISNDHNVHPNYHEIAMTKSLNIEYPREQFEEQKMQMTLEAFDAILQSNKQALWDLMVKLDIDIAR